ncbi:hypothetical protein AN215_02510 [Streptomyces abyssalis]|uniref:Uncharacterized protein n=1 Tax=Streptomyces abyssalis TaxID=933944 RepID=A0A1E7JUR1_9ACTN|nr:hypothetical protein AN215_02510 [Streptomyces abyssalis]
MGAGLLRHRPEAGEVRRVVHERRMANDRAVRQRGDGGFQMEHPGHGHGDHVCAQRLEGGAQLAHALLVRTSAEAHVHRSPALEHVPAVERPRRFHAEDGAAQGADRLLDGCGLGTPRSGPGPADQRRTAQDDHGVLHEHAVRAGLFGRHLDRPPAVVPQRPYIAVPLAHGERRVDRHPLQVGDQTLRETRDGRAYEGEGLRFGHGLTPYVGGRRAVIGGRGRATAG